MLVSLAEDIACELRTLNEIDANELELISRCMKYVQLHSKAKELRKIRELFRQILAKLTYPNLLFQAHSRFYRRIWIQHHAALAVVQNHHMRNHAYVSGNGNFATTLDLLAYEVQQFSKSFSFPFL